MSQLDFSRDLLGFQDVIVSNFTETNTEIMVFLSLKVQSHICPCCKCDTSYVHDYRIQKIHDIPLRGKSLTIVLRKRRYVCKHCGKRFCENNSFLPRYFRMTNRLSLWIINQLSSSSFKEVSKRAGVSSYTVSRRFDMLSFNNTDLPEVLSIDEFKGNAGKDKYQVILTDPVNHKVIDILPSRSEYCLSKYFNRYTKEQRDNVKYLVCDMYKPYGRLTQTWFKESTLITDKYHWIRQTTWSLENVRKRIQRQFSKDYRIYFKHSRKLLTTPQSKLTTEQKQQLYIMLSCSSDLSTTYFLKEQIYGILNAKSKEKAKENLRVWIRDAKQSKIPELTPAITAYTNWFESIINSCGQTITNGYTEGCNNKIKVLKRNAYGYRNFERFRKRILFMFNEKSA